MISHLCFNLYYNKINSTDGGHTIVIAIFLSSISIRKLSKKPVTANFELQYAVLKGSPSSPDIELITKIYPYDYSKYGKAYLYIKKILITL